ncbi:MAG: tRNA (adenosine(37)-N6)-threonylcarbamoyltransferase complex ATPase subunit type 1 TsaE [Thermoleophilia bacterium]|nr:tRNA (adenosine(37)-N6)-threonylcarbamoyltransferase complex ATPase subunit type 1 TsaE [Thermoleophilia bacterium]
MVVVGKVVLKLTGADQKAVEAVARRLARALRPGDVVLLFGSLGVGKTTFVRAVARALRVKDAVRSPSFTIANVYAGPVTVQHLDLYRLDDIAAEDALALEEYVRDDAVTLVEWPEAGLERLGQARWVVRLDHESLNRRRLELEVGDEEAAARWEAAELQAHVNGASKNGAAAGGAPAGDALVGGDERTSGANLG